MATPTQNWPKPFLLQIHEEAVKQGFVWIKPISEADAESLKSRLYRIRRRSDKSMAAFIPPEFHLVMIGQWEPDEGGRLPILFDKRADGAALPGIVAASGEEVERYVAQPRVVDTLPVGPPAELDLSTADLELKPDEIDSFVDSLRKKAKRGS